MASDVLVFLNILTHVILTHVCIPMSVLHGTCPGAVCSSKNDGTLSHRFLILGAASLHKMPVRKLRTHLLQGALAKRS